MAKLILHSLTWTLVSCRTFWNISSAQFSRVRLEEIELIAICVYNISATYSSDRSLIFLSEQLETDLSEHLVRRMSGEAKIISSASAPSQSVGFFFLFHNNKETTYAEILEKIPPNDVVRFAVILGFQERIDLRQLQKILEEFWKYQIIDVIVVVPYSISQNIRIYTYYPFSPLRCGQTGPPVLINVWNSRAKAFLNGNDLFSRVKKVFNLHGCPLNCVGVHRPPESTVVLMQDNTWQLSGTGSKVFKFLKQYMNFTAKISLVKRVEYNDKDNKVNNRTNQMAVHFDIAFGKFIRILDSHDPNADFISENVMDCFTWAVPHGIGRQPSIWTKYSIEFSAVIWFMIVFNIIVTSLIIRWMVSRLRVECTDWSSSYYALFYTFSTFIGANMKLKSRSSLMRLFISQWLWYSLVITSAYQAYLGSLMTIPQTEPEVDRQSDLLNTSLNLVGRREMFHLLNESAASSAEFRRLIDRFFVLPPRDFASVISRMIEQRDIAIFRSKRELIYYAQKRRSNRDHRKRDIHIFSDCVVKSYSSVFVLRKGSPFRDPVHRTLTRLFETGIYSFWDNENVLEEMYRNIVFSKETVLELLELYGAFVVLFIGLGSSSLVFFLELFGKMIRDKKKNSCDQNNS